jgi:hypothetical protein|tara:strand:- start:4001 stop:4243 length:243 start_codon:yes stop_codon:yes gene_type:complete
MYAKINARNKTVTLCKLIFSKSNKNIQDFNWIYNRTNGFKYKLCDCEETNECKSKNIIEKKSPNYKININIKNLNNLFLK